jgi:hypothetical protein
MRKQTVQQNIFESIFQHGKKIFGTVGYSPIDNKGG